MDVVSPSADSVTAEILALGDLIRTCKQAKSANSHDVIKSHVTKLLALKATYLSVTGHPFVPVAATPTPGTNTTTTTTNEKGAAGTSVPESGKKSKNQLKKEMKAAEAARKKAAGDDKKPKVKKSKTPPSETVRLNATTEPLVCHLSDTARLVSAASFASLTAASAGGSEGQVITPWEVEAEGGVDYDKLIDQFGCQAISPALIARLEKCIGQPAHRYLRRNFFFAHRDLEMILDTVEAGEKFYLYTGRGPSSGSLHLGHLIPFTFTAWLQKVFDVPLVIQLTNDEKYLFKNQSLEQSNAMMWENAKDIIACGFDLAKTFIFADTDYIGTMYPNILAVQKHVTYNQVRGIFGFSGTDNIGKSAFPAVQAAPSFCSTFPIVLGQGISSSSSPASAKPLRCLIPQAIDQDPYFRMTRDVAPRLGFAKPALIHSKFFPALQGASTKMSASCATSTIYVSDSADTVALKIRKYAFSGGGETKADHLAYGANLETDIAYQYLSFMLEDDDELETIGHEYAAGRLFSGQVKDRLIEVMTDFNATFATTRQAITDADVKAFMTVRPLTF